MAWENDWRNIAEAEALINPPRPRGWRGNVAALAATAKDPFAQMYDGKLPTNAARRILAILTGARKLPGSDPLTRLRKNYRFPIVRNLPGAVNNISRNRRNRLTQIALKRAIAQEATQWPQIRAARLAEKAAREAELRRQQLLSNLANAEATIEAADYLKKKAALNALAISRRRRGKGNNVYHYPYSNLARTAWPLAKSALISDPFAGITRENRIAAGRAVAKEAKNAKKLRRFKKTLKQAKTSLAKLEAIVENAAEAAESSEKKKAKKKGKKGKTQRRRFFENSNNNNNNNNND